MAGVDGGVAHGNLKVNDFNLLFFRGQFTTDNVYIVPCVSEGPISNIQFFEVNFKDAYT